MFWRIVESSLNGRVLSTVLVGRVRKHDYSLKIATYSVPRIKGCFLETLGMPTVYRICFAPKHSIQVFSRLLLTGGKPLKCSWARGCTKRSRAREFGNTKAIKYPESRMVPQFRWFFDKWTRAQVRHEGSSQWQLNLTFTTTLFLLASRPLASAIRTSKDLFFWIGCSTTELKGKAMGQFRDFRWRIFC